MRLTLDIFWKITQTETDSQTPDSVGGTEKV